MRKYAAVLTAGFLVLMVTSGSRFAVGLTFKPMAEAFDLSRGGVSVAIFTFMVVFSVCVFWSGHLSDRYRLRDVLTGGLLLCAIGIGLLSVVETAWQALLLYGIVYAVGSGFASTAPISVMVSRWFPGRIGLASSVAMSGMSIGQLVMMGVLAFVLVEDGWRPVYMWLGLSFLVLIPIVAFAFRRDPMQAPQSAGGAARPAEGLSLREAARTPYFWRLQVVFAICGFHDFFVATHIVPFAQDRNVDTLLAGNLLAFMGLTGLLGVVWAGAISDRRGPLLPTLACFVLRNALFVLILVSQDTVSIAIFGLLFGLTFLVTAPLTLIFVRQAFGQKGLGAITGCVTMVHHMCGGLGALVGALLFDWRGDYLLAFALMLALSLLATLLCFGLRPAVVARTA